ncbi:xylosyl- and glucuronyltransferase LARGE2s-like [Cydia amplana]|uniref:xylosyl- and glucuronyltransferase LARGE2s-like n=1 Tax=Cydia amplana TaxID=1869771 RepID=UPI002FE6928D
MTMRPKNVLSFIFLRPWLGVPFGIWIAVSVVYYWWLISRISILETQNKVLQVDSRKGLQVPYIPDAPGTLCETIHVALVCMSKCPRIVSPMLKSLLHHRQNPVHFHLIVDVVSEHTTKHLFETWDLPDVQYTTYNAQSILNRVAWIPTSHYSGVYALVKLLFPDILPATLRRVIVLDSDLTFLCDIMELWNMFRNMTDQQYIGLVENESNWYQNTEIRWPALGRGYNTGVMLLDLHKIRTVTDWTTSWHSAVNDNIDRLKTTALADQDVINAMIKKTPKIVYNISCHYNVQMSTETLAKSCYGEDVNNIKIIHWNSPRKYNVNIPDVEYFRSIHLSYVNFDGNQLREKLHRCDRAEAVTMKVKYFRSIHLSYVNFDGNQLREKLHRCDRAEAVTMKVEYFRSIHLSYVNFDGNQLREKLHRCDRAEAVTMKVEYFRSIHLSYVNFDGNQLREKLHRCDRAEAVTMKVEYFRSIHLSYVNFDGNQLREKLHRCDRAEAVTMKSATPSRCTKFRAAQNIKLRTHLYYMDYSYTNADNFDVTLVLQLSMDRLQFLERLVKHWEGPLSAAIYLSDCEVGVLESFIKDFSDTLSVRKNIGYHLVFKHESTHYPVNYLRNVALQNVNTPYVFLMDVDFVPMAGLYDHLRSVIKLVNPYPQKMCLVVAAFETRRYRLSPPRNKTALLARLRARRGADVAPFRAQEWPPGHRATNYSRWATATQPYQVDWENHYEPYIVVHRSVPKYDTRFSGFGWNKVSHSVELRALGYKVVVLPGAFVVHTPHAPSPAITAFRTNKEYRHCLALLKLEFMEDLRRKYNITLEDSMLHLGKEPVKLRAKDAD